MAEAAIRFDDVRSEPRDEVFHRVRVRLADGTFHRAVVVNLSPGGLMLRVDRTIAAGERLVVALPSLGEVAAEVRWALGGRAGCRFERPLPASGYASLRLAMGGGG